MHEYMPAPIWFDVPLKLQTWLHYIRHLCNFPHTICHFRLDGLALFSIQYHRAPPFSAACAAACFRLSISISKFDQTRPHRFCVCYLTVTRRPAAAESTQTREYIPSLNLLSSNAVLSFVLCKNRYINIVFPPNHFHKRASRRPGNDTRPHEDQNMIHRCVQ